MFSQKERCVYTNNQLIDVVCQLRYPTILAVAEKTPVEFQEAVRKVFPRYIVRHDAVPPKVTQVPGQPPKVEPQKPVINHQFLTTDGNYRINLTPNFISLSCAKYCCWEDFAQMMDKTLATFIKIYEPAYFERVGVRYLNAFSRKALDLEGVAWRELINPAYLGLMASEDLSEQAFARCNQDMEAAIPGGCRVKLHVGPGIIKRGQETEKEARMIVDVDVFMTGNLPVNLAAGAMQTVHAQAYSIFRDAITDTLHDAMEPDV